MPKREVEPLVPAAEWVELRPIHARPTEHAQRSYVGVFAKRSIRAFVLGTAGVVLLAVLSLALVVGGFGRLMTFYRYASAHNQFWLAWYILPLWVAFVPLLSVAMGLAGIWEERHAHQLACTPMQDAKYLFRWERTDGMLVCEVIRNIDKQPLGKAQGKDYRETSSRARRICWKDAKKRKVFLSSEFAVAVSLG
jgi:hypothetical protein